MPEAEDTSGEQPPHATSRSPRVPQLPTPDSPDSTAAQEEQAFRHGDYEERLKQDAATGRHRRREQSLDVLAQIMRLGLWAFLVAWILIGGSWIFHQVTPTSWHWLDPAQIDQLESLMVSSTVTAIVFLGREKILRN